MRKIFKIGAVLIALLLMFSACAKPNATEDNQTDVAQQATAEQGTDSANGAENSETTEKTVLKWWVWATVDIANMMSGVVFENEPEMNEKYEIQPELIANSVEISKKLRLMMASNETMPDIVMFQSEYLPEFSTSGALTDLSDLIKPMKDELTGGAYNLVTYEDKQWAMPYQIKPRVWIYRQDMFEEAGIEINPTDTLSVDEFIAAGKQLQEKYPDSYLWHMSISEGDTAILLRTLSGNNGAFFDENGEYIVDSNPGVRAAFEDIKKIYDAGLILNVPNDSNDMIQAYADGTIVSSLTASWIKNNVKKWAPDLSGKWAESQWPTVGGGNGGGEGGSVWVFPENAENRDAAIEFMSKLVLTKEGNLGAFEARSIYPSLIEAVNDPIIQAPHEYVGPSLPIAEAEATKNFTNFNYSINYANEMKIVNQYFVSYLNGQMTLDEALTAANDDLKGQIGNAFE